MKVGFAKTEITPPLGVGLSGFGPFLQRRATSVYSPIYANAVAFDDGENGWAIVSCDLMGLGSAIMEPVWALVDEATGWDRNRVALHSTHTHSAPTAVDVNVGWGELDGLYRLKLPHYIARAVIDAIANLQPAVVSQGDGELSHFAHNRTKPSPGLDNEVALSWGWDTDLPEEIDSAVRVFRVDDPQGSIMGFLAYYSCHPVVACEETSAVHGDFAGEAIRMLEASHPGSVGLFLQGAHGDINPNYAHGPEEQSFVALEQFAARFAAAVEVGLGSARPLESQTLGYSRREIPFDIYPYSIEELKERREAKAAVALSAPLASPTFTDSHAGVFAIGLAEVVERIERGDTPNSRLFAHSLALGEFLFTGVNLELYHGIQRRHSAEFGPRHLLVSVTNGWSGYGPTEEAYFPPFEPYAAFEVPLISAQLPYESTIAERILETTRKTVADAELARDSTGS